VEALLQPNEALVLFLDTDARFKPTSEETFIWVVTKGDVRWVKSELGTKALTEGVAVLRCGLDAALWDDESAAARCRAAWFARSHALTVLPPVSSLKALRQLAKESRANRTLVGFGNPLLNGPDAGYATLAAAARSKTSCPDVPKVAELTGKRRGVLPLTLRSGLADAGQIRSQVPLPETADELCAVARDLGATNQDIWLGNRAPEAKIKRLSEAGELAKYRIIHFATHGALAGQVSGNSVSTASNAGPSV
jgi:CHAT domain-containing protein